MKTWVIPYVDQELGFWERLYQDFADAIREVYFPFPGDVIGSGRPSQPQLHLQNFLRHAPFPLSVLVNPVILRRSVGELAPAITETLKRLDGEFGLAGATVSDLLLAARIRECLPDLPLTASTLIGITQPNQVLMIQGICDGLVPATSILRDMAALRSLQAAFNGRIRLIVNEACLPGCPFRIQHFYEMGSGFPYPHSLCGDLLQRHPWMRLTSAWVLPQHLYFYDGIYDELKLAGRVTLQDPTMYYRVLDAYIHRKSLMPCEIGGGPASVLEPIEISEDFFARTLECKHNCHECYLCREYYKKAVTNHERKKTQRPSVRHQAARLRGRGAAGV